MRQSSLFCIHGFIGHPDDWLSVLPENARSERISLFAPSKENPFFEGALNFHELSQWIYDRAVRLPEPRILVGYSLGGRIGLYHLLKHSVKHSELWSKAVIISAHPGLTDESEKQRRLESDVQWAKRFSEETLAEDKWSQLLLDWNNQPTFKGGLCEPSRPLGTYSRTALSSALKNLSLGRQANFRVELNKLNVPLSWVTGANDSKFSTLAKEISNLNNPSITTLSIEDSGHRILFDQPQVLKKLLTQLTSK